MIREDVTIVLNEREATKAHAATELEQRLKLKNITASRLPITGNLCAVLRTRKPRIIVTDYLLGDITTGLDVVEAVTDQNSAGGSCVIFLTDEPSAAVAVAALRSGARHYLELESPGAIDAVVLEIEDVLRGMAIENPEPLLAPPRPGLIALAKAGDGGRASVTQAQAAIARRSPVIVVCGPSGSGVTTMLRAIAEELYPGHSYREVDLQTTLAERSAEAYDHAECDDGRLFTRLQNYSTRPPHLLIGTTEPEVARMWLRLPDAACVEVAPLTARRDDIPHFVRLFARELEPALGRKACLIDASDMTTFATQTWEGNIRQLRAVVHTTLAERSISEQPLASLIPEEAMRFMRYYTPQPMEQLSPLAAAATIAACGSRYQLAALRLGCSVSDLVQYLGAPALPGTPSRGSIR